MKMSLSDLLTDGLLFAGAIVVSFGVGLLSIPAGIICFGLAIIGIGIMAALGGEGR